MNRTIRMEMPKTLAIIGNGFDLALDAKTTYESFYNCLKQCFQAKSIEGFKNLYIYDDNEELIASFYDLVTQNRDNYFINYFLNYEIIFGSWVSFEKELTKIIKSLDYLVTLLNLHDKLLIEHVSPPNLSTYVKIGGKTNLFQVLNVYPDNKYFRVDKRAVQFFNGNSALLFSIAGKQFKKHYDVYKGIEEFSEYFPNYLYNDLVVFSNLFSLYLGIVDHFVSFDKIIKDAFDTSYFINYNFTNYLENIIKKSGIEDCDIIYINGLAENINALPKEKIVFGIDSNTNLDNLSFEIFTKRIQRSIKETDISHLSQVLNNSFETICVFGHSLNVADHESLSFIFSACESSYKPRIKVYYYDILAKRDLIINLKTILGNDKFDEYQREGYIELIESEKAWTEIKNK